MTKEERKRLSKRLGETKAFVRKRLIYWQERLALQAWKFSLTIVKELTNEDGEEAYGHIHWYDLRQRAFIKLATTESHQDAPEKRRDRTRAEIEESLIHELLHILKIQCSRVVSERMMRHLSPAMHEELGMRYEHETEREIWSLAKALMRKD